MNRWSDQTLDRRVAEAFAETERTMAPPTELRRRLAELGEPDPAGRVPDGRRSPNRSRLLYLAAAAACLVVAVGGLLSVGNNSTGLQPVSTAPSSQTSSATPAPIPAPSADATAATTPTSAPAATATSVSGSAQSATSASGSATSASGSAAPDPVQVPFVPTDRDDDPNRFFDGTEGRLPPSPNPVPVGFPTPLTTGFVAAGLTTEDLQPLDGLVIDEPTVLDGVDIDGSVQITSSDVTIRNSRITATSLYTLRVHPGVENVVIENTRIRGIGGGVSAAIYLQSPAILTGLDISGGAANIKAVSGFTLEDSYLADIYRRPDGTGSSANGIQIRQGSGFTIRGNSIVAGWQVSGAAIRLDADSGSVQDAAVDGNYLSGGAFTLTTGNDGFDFVGVRISDNRFETGSWTDSWIRNGAGAVVEGNTQLPS